MTDKKVVDIKPALERASMVTNSNLRLLQWHWFNGRECIGIVLCEDVVTHEEKCYIGTVLNGINEISDAEHIALHGSKFPVNQAKQIMGL